MSTRLFKSTRYLVLALLLLQGFAPALTQARNQLAMDAAFCGTQVQPAADVLIRSPLADDEAPTPESHSTEHCSLCYIYTPATSFNSVSLVAVFDTTEQTPQHFHSNPNLALQDQHLQRLAFTHAPPRLS